MEALVVVALVVALMITVVTDSVPALSIRAMLCSACGVRRSFSHVANPTLVPSTAEQEDRRTELTVLRTLVVVISPPPNKNPPLLK